MSPESTIKQGKFQSLIPRLETAVNRNLNPNRRTNLTSIPLWRTMTQHTRVHRQSSSRTLRGCRARWMLPWLASGSSRGTIRTCSLGWGVNRKRAPFRSKSLRCISNATPPGTISRRLESASSSAWPSHKSRNGTGTTRRGLAWRLPAGNLRKTRKPKRIQTEINDIFLGVIPSNLLTYGTRVSGQIVELDDLKRFCQISTILI